MINEKLENPVDDITNDDNSSEYKLSGYNDMIDNVDVDEIKQMANKYLNTDNYVKVVLYPQK